MAPAPGHVGAIPGPGGRTVPVGISGKPMPPKANVKTLSSGVAVQTRGNGRISDVHNPNKGMGVHTTLTGAHQVHVERRDGSHIYAERGRPGYIQHSYSYQNRTFSRRTYYYQGRVYDRYYSPYYYHGVYVNVYMPMYYYSPGFYGWAYNPWYRPVAYGWGWGSSPWVTFYGGYFTPYPTYADASFWLTDYMVAADLQAQYQANQAAQLSAQAEPVQGGQPELTPEIKGEIATEVRNQIALENDQAKQQNAPQTDPGSTSIARTLQDSAAGHAHVFVVGGSMDMVDASGTECALSAGDVLSLPANSAVPADAQAADVVVVASKGGQECGKSDTVTVQLSDLQEMQNHMQETIDQGMQELQAKAGQGGLPAAPPSAKAPPAETAFAQNAPPPDPTGAADINQQLTDADAAVSDATTQARQQGMDVAAAPVTVAAGETFDQVQAALGQPTQIIDVGAKKVYIYSNMKITFRNGKVSDVQ